MPTHLFPPDPATQLARKHHNALRARVIARADWLLRRSGWQLATDDIDQAYNDAWLNLMDAVKRGRAPAQFTDTDCPPAPLRRWLVKVTFRRAIDFIRSSHPERYVELDDPEEYTGDEVALATRLDDRHKIQQLMDVLNHRFSERDAQILVLVGILDVPRRDVAERFEMSLKRLHKVLDGHKGRTGIREEMRRYVELISEGRWCDEQASLLTAFRLGWFAPGSPKDLEARAHLKSCASCRLGA